MPAPRGVFALLVSFVVTCAATSAALPAEPAAAVAWQLSRGLVLAEVMTGGASASDEYVEVANAGATAADLGGCELVYASASGATVTRKASFATPLNLAPGQHLLVANAAGIYGPLADATYSGGLAADGGAVALRLVNGTVIDSVGWGTATNSFVEGAVAPAPPAGSSIERLPGGSNGNNQDSNDNRADWFVQSHPIPQSLASLPVLSPTPTPPASDASATESAPTDTATPELTPPTASTPTDTPAPTATPTPTDTPAPTATPTPSTSPTPSPTPSPSPSPSISVSSTPTITAGPTASPTPAGTATTLRTIAWARGQSVGTHVHVVGAVTVEPGLVGADGLFVVQDTSGAIFVRVSTPPDRLVEGSSVEVEGTLAAPYGQLEIRDVASISLGEGLMEPEPSQAVLGDVGEQTEASLVAIAGTVESVQTDSGRLTISIGDGTHSVRLLADPPTGLSRSDVARSDTVVATGIVGQHATATGRLDGYCVWLRHRADIVVSVQSASPSTSSSALPKAISTSPSEGSASTPAPTGKPVYLDLASAIGTRGAAVDVEAVVTATAGLLDVAGPTIVVDDGTAAAAVIVPVGTVAPGVGMRVHVIGKIGRWEGGPTVLASQVVAEGQLEATVPRPVAGSLDASLEWQLIQICGRIDGYTPAGSRWRLDVLVDGHTVVVLGEPAAAIAVTKASVGRMVVVVGIVRRSTSDSSAFQLLPRMAVDFRLGPALDALDSVASTGKNQTGASPRSGAPSSGLKARSVEIGSLSGYVGRSVTVAGLVTGTADGAATIDDGTGQVRVGGAAATDALANLEPGDAVEVTGSVREDDQGLIIEADPASIVDLPGDSGDGSAAAGAVDRVVAGVPATKAVSMAPQASIRRASPGATPPDGPTLLLVTLLTLLAVAGSLTLARRRHGLARIVHRSSEGPARRLAAALARWPWLGREQGQ